MTRHRYRSSALAFALPAVLAWGTVRAADLPPEGVYRAAQVSVTATGTICGFGVPLEPGYLLRVGKLDHAQADDSVGVLLDDAGVAMSIVQDKDGALDLVDLSDPKAGAFRKLGTVAPGAAPLSLDVAFSRYDLSCEVRGTLHFVPATAPADAHRITQMTRAWLLMNDRDVLRHSGQPRAALVPAREAKALFDAELGPRHRLSSMTIGAMSSLHFDLREDFAARALAEQALAGLRQTLGDDHLAVLQQTNNLALVAWNLGDLAFAEARLRDIVQRYERLLDPDHGARLGSLANLARLMAERGRHAEGEAMLRETVLRRERAFGRLHGATMRTLTALAVAYRDSGWLDEAEVQMRTVHERYLEAAGPRNPLTLRARHGVADILLRRGERALAIAELRAVLDLRREVLGPRNAETLITQRLLAEALLDLGATGEALALQRDAAAISHEVAGAEAPVTLQSETTLGRIESRAGDHATAVARLRRAHALAALRLGREDPAAIEIAEQLGYAQIAAGERAVARATLEGVVETVETWRARTGFTASRRAVLFARWARAYKELALVAAAQGDLAAAFAQAERAKARVLVESLALRRGETPAVLPRAALARLADLDARVTKLEMQQARAPEAVLRNQLGQELATAVATAAEERAALRARHPRYAELSQPRLVSAREGAAALEPGAVFVSYLVQDQRVFAFLLTRDARLRGHDLGSVAGLQDTVTAYRALLAGNAALPAWRLPDDRFVLAAAAPPGARRVTDPAEIGALLFARLVQPLPALTRAARWVIALDGPLGLVPFETLPDGAGLPLVATRVLRYTPSLTVHTLTARRAGEYKRADRRAPLYAMGAALYNKPGTDAATATPRSVDAARLADALGEEPGAVRRAYDRLGRSWPQLPASQVEIDAVTAAFKPLGAVRVRARGDATERQLRDDDRSGLLARHRFVLLSAHGYLSTESPALSAVVLGRQEGDESTDGYVTAAEWTGYSLRSDLIVVSACETGVGRVIEGEGIAGLPYAFFVAGNRNALLTLWPVADASAAAFVVRFFELVRAGLPQADALAAVKREFVRGGRYRAPVHWAPFVLWGS